MGIVKRGDKWDFKHEEQVFRAKERAKDMQTSGDQAQKREDKPLSSFEQALHVKLQHWKTSINHSEVFKGD